MQHDLAYVSYGPNHQATVACTCGLTDQGLWLEGLLRTMELHFNNATETDIPWRQLTLF
jgi:hypothetical protein